MPDPEKKIGGVITIIPEKKEDLIGGEITIISTNQPTREQIMREHMRPRDELHGLSHFDLDQTVKKAPVPPPKAKPKPRYPATLKPGPSTGERMWRGVGAFLRGDKRSGKDPEDMSGWEKHGAVGTAARIALPAAGILPKEEQEEFIAEMAETGGLAAGGIKGFQYGARAGGWRGALAGGALGGTLGASLAHTAVTGTPPTPGRQAENLFWGLVPPGIKPGVGALKGATTVAGQLAVISETAQQSQHMIDEGEPLSLHPVEIVKRNIVAVGLGGALGGVAGRKLKLKGETDPAIVDALGKLEQRVDHFKRRIKRSRHGMGGKKGRAALKEAENDLGWFLEYHQALIDTNNPMHASAQAVRVSQVVRQGAEYEAVRDLRELHQLFEPTPAVPQTARQKFKTTMDEVRERAVARHYPLERVQKEIHESRGLPKPKHDLAAKFETHAGSWGKAELAQNIYDDAVVKPLYELAPRKWHGLRGKGDKVQALKDFDEYMFLHRTKQRLEFGQKVREAKETRTRELRELKKVPEKKRSAEEKAYIKVLEKDLKKLEGKSEKEVENWDLEKVNNLIPVFKREMGEARYAQLEKSAEAFQVELDKALKLQVESGRMSQARYDDIKKANDFYAPFALRREVPEGKLGDPLGGGMDSQVDFTQAIKGIHRKFKLHSIVEKGREQVHMSTILAEKNRRMLEFKKVADLDTEGLFIKKLKPHQEPTAGFKKVTVLVEGEQVHYQVDGKVHRAIEAMPQIGEFTMMAAKAALPAKAGFTGLSIPFSIWNLPTDFTRAAMISEQGWNPGQLDDAVSFIWTYARSLHHSMLRQVGAESSKYGKMTGAEEWTRAAQEAGVMRSGVQQMITPSAGLEYRALDKRLGVLDTLSKFANAVEESFKVTGVQRAMQKAEKAGKPYKNVQELLQRNPEIVTDIRRYMGSPDFQRFGRDMQGANFLFMFLNARVQGGLGDIAKLKDKRAMTNSAMWIGGPTVALWTYNQEYYKKEL